MPFALSASTASPSRRRLSLVALTALVALGLALRLAAIDFLLPHLTEVHERVYLMQTAVIEARVEHPEQDPNYGFYPHLVPRLALALSSRFSDVLAHGTLEEHLAQASARTLTLRKIIAWLSITIVPATWLLARLFVGRGYALIAAGLLATSPMHVWFSQQARPHGAAAGLTVLAVVATVLVRRRGDLRSYLLAGVALSLALSTLQSACAAGIALVTAHLLRRKPRRLRDHLALLAALAVVLLAVRWAYPALFLGDVGTQATQLHTEGGAFHLGGHAIVLTLFRGKGFGVLADALWDFEPLLACLALLGLILVAVRAIRERWRPRIAGNEDRLVVLSYALPYALVVGLYGLSLERFALPLLPFLACLAVIAIREIAELAGALVRKPEIARPAGATLAVGVLALQATAALKITAVHRAPDTFEQAARWLESNLQPERQRIAIQPNLDLPLLRTEMALFRRPNLIGSPNHPWVSYQAKLSPEARRSSSVALWDFLTLPLQDPDVVEQLRQDPLAYLASLDGIEYAVIEPYDEWRRPLLARLHEGMMARGRLVARISPWRVDDGNNLGFLYDENEFPMKGSWTGRLFAARCHGPVLEIYRWE